MEYNEDLILILNGLFADEEVIRSKVVELIVNNRLISDDFNMLKIIDDLKDMNLKQCQLLKSMLENYSSINKSDVRLLILNNIIENLNCNLLNDLSICEDLFIESPKNFKKQIIDKYNLKSKTYDELELELIMTSKKLLGSFNNNYKKLIKKGV